MLSGSRTLFILIYNPLDQQPSYISICVCIWCVYQLHTQRWSGELVSSDQASFPPIHGFRSTRRPFFQGRWVLHQKVWFLFFFNYFYFYRFAILGFIFKLSLEFWVFVFRTIKVVSYVHIGVMRSILTTFVFHGLAWKVWLLDLLFIYFCSCLNHHAVMIVA